jgi:hypothetical protein
MVEFSATLPSAKSRDLNTSLTILPPLMVRHAFHAGKSGRNLSRTENISPVVVVDREACEPFLPPSPKLAHADGSFLIADLLTDDVIRWADIFLPASVNQRRRVQIAFIFGLAHHSFSCLKTFQGDRKAPFTDVNRSLHLLARTQLPGRFRTGRLAADAAFPARFGYSARWPAAPSRCQTRDAPPHRGP